MPGKKHDIFAFIFFQSFRYNSYETHLQFIYHEKSYMWKNFDEKTKKSQLDIHVSVTYNKSFSLNSQVIYTNAKICNFNLKHLKILIGFIWIKKNWIFYEIFIQIICWINV